MINIPNLKNLTPADRQLLNSWRWPNFRPEEFTSAGDTGALLIEPEFLDRLQKLRSLFNRPLVINSGYRSPNYNAKVSSTGLTGPHTTGRAVDIKCLDSGTRYTLVAMALDLGFTGIGIAKTFVHLDDIRNNTKIPRPMMWLY